MIKKIKELFVAFVICLFMGTLLMEVIYLLPVEPMQRNLRESVDAFVNEGDNPFLLEGYKGSSLDNSTDAIMLGNAVFDSEKPFYEAAMYVERAKEEDGDNQLALQQYLSDGEAQISGGYARYWHGYLVILKPLLMFLNFGQIRLLNGIVFGITVLAILLLFMQRNMWRAGIGFILAVMCLFPMTIPYSLQFSSVFYIGAGAVCYVLCRGEKIENKKNWEIFFLIVGACTSYIDFLTYPLFTLGMPLVLCIVMERHRVFEVIKNSVCWCFGYFGMWIGKWTVGSLITGTNLWLDAVAVANTRLSETAYDKKINRIVAILRNLYIYKGTLSLILMAVICVWVLFGVYRYRKNIRIEQMLPLLMIALMPFVWYLLMANHSYIHYWYTFRALSVSVFAVTMIPEVFKSRRR